MTETAGRVPPTWLNPPRHTDPHEDVLVRYSQAEARAVVAALRLAEEAAEQAGDLDTSRTLNHAAGELESACSTPAEADAKGLSREATWHPANIASRVTVAAIRNAARWLGPRGTVREAIDTAAAIAWSRGGDQERDELIQHTRMATDRAAKIAYPRPVAAIGTSIVINRRVSENGLDFWVRVAQWPADRAAYEAYTPDVREIPELSPGELVEVVLVEASTDDRIAARETFAVATI